MLGVVAALVVVVALVGVGIYFATKNSTSVAASTAPTATAAPNTASPVEEMALEGLLLNHDQINTAAGSVRMTIKVSSLWWNDIANISPLECLPLLSPMEKDVYAGSGWTAARSQEFSDFEGPEMARIAARQGVVLFPSAQAAAAFVSVSQQKWSACASSSFTLSYPGFTGTHPWTTGQVTSTNGTFAATSTRQDGNGWACQRALTARNNVVIDTGSCSHNITDQAVSIAGQIAAKVPTT